MSPQSAVTARPVRTAQIAFALILAIKLYFSFTAPPLGDEAYYWMWGQKPGWSYFDHPPLHTWLLGVVSLLGWNLVALRLLTWLTLAGTLAIMWLWSRRLKPEDPAAWFWPSAAMYLATPLFFMMTSFAFHDHLLILLCLGSAHSFLVFGEKWEATGRGFGWLYGAATLLGLAVLTKYNGVLFGIGAAIFFVAYRPMRPLWFSPHLYLAALLSVALQAPVLWWNLAEGFASYNFHLSDRWGGELLVLRPINLAIFVAVTIVVVSPFLFLPIASMMRHRSMAPFADRARVFALSVFAVSTFAMLALSLFARVFFYWNILALLPLMPLLAGWMPRRWVFNAHLLYGLVGALVATLNFAVIPIGSLTGSHDWTTASSYGWPEVAARIRVLEEQHPVGFVAATRYTTAAQLGFALRDADVTALAVRRDQYDYWFDPKIHEGQSALVVADPVQDVAYASRYFDQLTLLETLRIERLGQVVYEPQIYLGSGFHAAPRD